MYLVNSGHKSVSCFSYARGEQISENDEKLKFVIVAFRKRMALLSIYYQTLDTEVTEEKPAYDLNDFGGKLIMVTA